MGYNRYAIHESADLAERYRYWILDRYSGTNLGDFPKSPDKLVKKLNRADQRQSINQFP